MKTLAIKTSVVVGIILSLMTSVASAATFTSIMTMVNGAKVNAANGRYIIVDCSPVEGSTMRDVVQSMKTSFKGMPTYANPEWDVKSLVDGGVVMVTNIWDEGDAMVFILPSKVDCKEVHDLAIHMGFKIQK